MQGVRTLARFYVCLFIPLFFGPYWAWVSWQTNFAFSFFFSILVGPASPLPSASQSSRLYPTCPPCAPPVPH